MKAKNLFLILGACCLCAIGISFAVETESNLFHSYRDCEPCHSKIVSEWQQSLHSIAGKNPIFWNMSRERDYTEVMMQDFPSCMHCFLPVGVLSGEIPPKDGSGFSALAWEGVNCDICHGIDLSPPGIRYTSKTEKTVINGGLEAHKKSLKNLDLVGNQFCFGCGHGFKGAAPESRIKELGVSCQDCHMYWPPRLPEEIKENLPSYPKDQEPVLTHLIPGSKIHMSEYFDKTEQKQRQLDLIRLFWAIRIQPPQWDPDNHALTINIDIDNRFNPHPLPPGIPPMKDAWLEIRVTDEKGKTLTHIGGMSGIEIDPRAHIYRLTVNDPVTDREMVRYWESGRHSGVDNKIPPESLITDTYSLPLHGKKIGKINISAVLKYRVFSQKLANLLLGPNNLTVPVIDIAEDRIEFEL